MLSTIASLTEVLVAIAALANLLFTGRLYLKSRTAERDRRRLERLNNEQEKKLDALEEELQKLQLESVSAVERLSVRQELALEQRVLEERLTLEEQIFERRRDLERSASEARQELELRRIEAARDLLDEQIERVDYLRSRRDFRLPIENQETLEGEDNLEPTVFIGLIGSIASIIGLLQQNKEALNPKSVLSQFRQRQRDPSTTEFQLGKIVTEDEILEHAATVLAIHKTDHLWLERISKRCLEPLNAAIADHGLDEVDLEEKRGEAATCVCSNIKMARDENGGKFPSDEFKELWKRFKCS